MARRAKVTGPLLTFLLSGLLISPAQAQQKKDAVDYVDPNIGGIGQLLQPTWPLVYLPYGMMRIVPITTPGIKDRYLADKIFGFPGAGGLVMMPMAGPVETDPQKYASLYDHDLETATPYYYAVLLEKYNLHVEYTASERAAFYRFDFPANTPAHVLFTVSGGGDLQLVGNNALSGSQESHSGGRVYFYAELTKPCTSSTTQQRMQVPHDSSQHPWNVRAPTEPGLGIVTDFHLDKGERLGVRLGISYISVEQAHRNLWREIPSSDFERAKAQARDVWRKTLGQIEVKGGTEEQRTVFYTALYRLMQKPTNRVEEDRYDSPVDHQVHPADGRGFYPAGGDLWGSYRSQLPLQLLLDPQRQIDFVRSFLALYDESGRMMGTGRSTLVGHHVAALVLDTYIKGYRDFDIAKAYEGLKKNAMQESMVPEVDCPQTELDRFYLEKGYFPALAKGETENVKEVTPFDKRQAVSVTLEAAYDDWCTAQVAKIVNRPDDYAYFMKRAHNYENVFDQRTGFMAPKTSDGNWRYAPEEFDPIWAGGSGGRDYYSEMNAWIYTFHVQQDVAGLIRLMGGREKFTAKLDALFTEQYEIGRAFSGLKLEGYNGDVAHGLQGERYLFQYQFPDMTGLIGQYAQGNEPSFHIPYLYNYAGEPWKTQRKLREIMKVWFTTGIIGLPGDEDEGEESSWYVLSAMGFYPVCPGRPVYDIGSPIFAETRITLSNGKVFTITAKDVSAVNKYIQSALLNGQPLNKPWFTHADIANGGSLVFQMGPRPNTAWGSSPEAAPPSMPE